jgi:hypothetical protein
MLIPRKKDAMHIPRTCLVLILAILLLGACKDYSPARPASATPLASLASTAQPFSATPTIMVTPPGAGISSSNVYSLAPMVNKALQASEADPDINPESSFPLAPDTVWDAGNGGSEEEESSGAFSLHSTATLETVDQFYQSALADQGWQLRYIDANQAGGLTQYWNMGVLYMSVAFTYDPTGLAIQAHWHLVDPEYVQMLPQDLPLPDQAEFVDATDSTWELYLPQEMDTAIKYYQQKAAVLNWEPAKLPDTPVATCAGDCLTRAAPAYPPGVTPMPTSTPDPRQPQRLVYIMTGGDQLSLEFQPHQDATVLDITLTLHNVDSAGLPKELQVYPGATGLVIAPGLLRFTAPVVLPVAVQFYSDALLAAGWKVSSGYNLDTPQLYFQQWDKGQQALRLNISSPGSSSQTSLVSIQCLQCTPP